MFLHEHKDFPELIRIVAEEKAIHPYLVEKDYWLMHCLYGLQQMGLFFELKGGTSLSKGFGIIQRFSEDIDIRIEPPKGIDVAVGKNQDKPTHIDSRAKFYEHMAATIKIPGIVSVVRDHQFDDVTGRMRSGGIRLVYKTSVEPLAGLKEGTLLELGFDVTSPNEKKDISSWLVDAALKQGAKVNDNRAPAVPCYHPGYTLVEKLQAVSTKFRKQQANGDFHENFLRHYYDIACLLKYPAVQDFIGTTAYQEHKEERFRTGDNPVLKENEAFLLSKPEVRELYRGEWQKIRPLFYGQDVPLFDDLLGQIGAQLSKL